MQLTKTNDDILSLSLTSQEVNYLQYALRMVLGIAMPEHVHIMCMRLWNVLDQGPEESAQYMEE